MGYPLMGVKVGVMRTLRHLAKEARFVAQLEDSNIAYLIAR